MFVVFECVDLADMLSLWCCNPVTNSVLYLLVGIWFLAYVALNYNHFLYNGFSVGLRSKRRRCNEDNKFINISATTPFVWYIESSCALKTDSTM